MPTRLIAAKLRRHPTLKLEATRPGHVAACRALNAHKGIRSGIV
jgi:hypothetical protein